MYKKCFVSIKCAFYIDLIKQDLNFRHLLMPSDKTHHEWISKSSLCSKRRRLRDHFIGHITRIVKSICAKRRRSKTTKVVKVVTWGVWKCPILIGLLLLWLLHRHSLEWIFEWIYRICCKNL